MLFGSRSCGLRFFASRLRLDTLLENLNLKPGVHRLVGPSSVQAVPLPRRRSRKECFAKRAEPELGCRV